MYCPFNTRRYTCPYVFIKTNKGINATYEYYPNNLRLSKTVNGAYTGFIWDGSQITAEFDSDYNLTNIYMFGRGQSRISGTNLNTNKKTYYMYNTHGDVQGLINWAGDLTKNYEYDAFGNEINKVDTDTNPFRYCGEYYDTETGNIYLRNRYYNPAVGAFITEDPIRDGSNWYSYCGGNPVMFVDPSGLALYFENYVGKDLFNTKGDAELTTEQRQIVEKIMDDLNKITDYNLIYENGYVTTNYSLKNPEEIEHPFGNILISRILSSSNEYRILDVSGNNENSRFGYIVENKQIRYVVDPKNEAAGIYVMVDGKPVSNVDGSNPTYIALVHELIHAYRDDLGVFDYAKEMVDNNYPNLIIPGEQVLREELQTVGTGTWYSDLLNNNHYEKNTEGGFDFIISENDLRKENNLPIRARY